MPIDTIRDIVLIVAAIVWSLVFLVILIVVAVLFFFVHRYLGVAHGLLRDKARPAIAQVQERMEAVRLRTAALPGHPAVMEAVDRAPRRAGFNFSLPFRRRRKPWYQRLTGG